MKWWCDHDVKHVYERSFEIRSGFCECCYDTVKIWWCRRCGALSDGVCWELPDMFHGRVPAAERRRKLGLPARRR